MNENQARRVAVEFTIRGANHAEITKRATTLWRTYLGEEDATLPFDTEFNVTTGEIVGDHAGNIMSVEWEATVIIRQRGSNYS
jgi:hypothetical protein